MDDRKAVLHLIETSGVKRNSKGKIATRIGATLSLYFFDGEKMQIREGIAKIIEEYHSTFGEKLTHFHFGKGRKLVSFRNNSIDQILVTLLKTPARDNFYFKSLEFDPSEPSDPALYSIVAFGFGSAAFEPLSGIKMHFPAAYVVEDCDRFLEFVLTWAGYVKARHGTAGLGILTIQGDEIHNPLHFDFLKEFIGLDYDAMGSYWARTAGKATDCIRSSNWLTLLDAELVEKLGGLQQITASLNDSAVTVLEYDAGIAFRAADFPRLGNTEKNSVPIGYRQVAKIVNKIRFEDYDYGVINVPDGLDGREETIRWLRRFD